MKCQETCKSFKIMGIDACLGCAGDPLPMEVVMEKKTNTIKRELLNILNPLGRCKHGLIRCTCGVCTKHPLSVAKKGGHVVGSSSSSPTNIQTIGCCHNSSQRNYHW